MSESQRKTTVHDVARVAGLSAMSVSRALSGKRPVTEETARRVAEAVKLTGFRLNRSASNLRQGRSLMTLGVVVDRLDDPYFASLIRSAQSVIDQHSGVLVAASRTQETSQSDLVTALVERGVDGLLIQPSEQAWVEEVASGPPVALLSRTLGLSGFDAVVVDNEGGAFAATSHLLSLGHRRIAAIDYGDGPPPVWREAFEDTRADRLRGFNRALESANLTGASGMVVQAGPTVDGAAAAVSSLAALAEPPTALLCLTGRMTIGAIRALGPSLGGFGLVGIDDFELAEALSPPVTVVTQDPEAMGREGAQLLLDRIADPTADLRRIERPMKLIVRESGLGTRL